MVVGIYSTMLENPKWKFQLRRVNLTHAPDLDRWSSGGPAEEIKMGLLPRFSPDLLLLTSLGSPAGCYIEVGLGPCLSHLRFERLRKLTVLPRLTREIDFWPVSSAGPPLLHRR
jgi:hypothetical protein